MRANRLDISRHSGFYDSKVGYVLTPNVLIYFDMAMKKRVVHSLYDVLNHGGHLFLGEAESLHGISAALKIEHFRGAFAYVKE